LLANRNKHDAQNGEKTHIYLDVTSMAAAEPASGQNRPKTDMGLRMPFVFRVVGKWG
jgi:hypothetical protein